MSKTLDPRLRELFQTPPAKFRQTEGGKLFCRHYIAVTRDFDSDFKLLPAQRDAFERFVNDVKISDPMTEDELTLALALFMLLRGAFKEHRAKPELSEQIEDLYEFSMTVTLDLILALMADSIIREERERKLMNTIDQLLANEPTPATS